MGFLKSLRVYVEALVHPSVRTEPGAFARHSFFIATRLSAGLIAFAALPVYLAARGVPSMLEAIAYCWFLLPLFVALYVSRTGAFERAHVLSAVTLAAPLGLFAGMTGTGSFALWAALAPIEAILFCARPVAMAAGASAFAAFGALWAFAAFWLLPAYPSVALDPASLGLTGGLVVAAYLVFVAFGARVIADSGTRLSQASEARYRTIAQNTGELITGHGRNGAVTFASPAAEKLLGTPAFRLMGHGLFDRVHVADRPAFLTAISESAIKKKAVVLEYRLRREAPETDQRSPAEPSFIWVETRCHPDDSEKSHIVAVTKDISSRKTAELALGDARLQAEQANDAKYRFLATVSHELRTPLNAIIGFSEILASAPVGSVNAEYQSNYARLIRDSGEHLLAVVNSILDVSRIESGQFMVRPKSFPIAALIEACVEIMTLDAKQKGIFISVELSAALPEIVADERAVRQIVLNLVSNAIKFSGQDGRVVIGGRVERDEFVLSVTDSGIGIAEGDLKQIGNPFFQAHASYDRPYEGSGLGLSVVKGLIESHGGRIDIASRLGEGTKVTMRLPLVCRHDGAGRHAVIGDPAKPTIVNESEEKVRRRA
jgi:two-component system, cell cycle sensor histidine kinase DivJ